MTAIDVNGCTLDYESMGSGQAIVWLQGARSGRT
jgi:hypothetical protein